MNIKELRREQAKEAMAEWISNPGVLPQVPSQWVTVRTALQDEYQRIEQNTDIKDDSYKIDVCMGLYLYEYFRNQDFTMRSASNDGFWRYMTLKVAPDLVGKRWGNEAKDHYWTKPSRNWFRSIWWYVHLSWQGDRETTRDVLMSQNFNTDIILNLGERTGRNGTYIDVYRYIVYFYSTIPKETLAAYNEKLHKYDKHATLFRTVMKLNTARALVVEPAFFLGGPLGYAESLFEEAGVKLDEA